jgi:hypothetical protein
MRKQNIHSKNGLKGCCIRWGVNADPIIRFWSKVKITDFFNCWIWQAGYFSNGYGAYCYNAKTRRAHRVAWEFTYGPIPKGKIVMHICDNPKCVNPNHLRIGTNRENSTDAIKKGRIPKGQRHPLAKLTADNVLEIRNRVATGISKGELAEHYGVAKGTIQDVITRSWQHI